MLSDIMLLMVSYGCDAAQAKAEYAQIESFLILRDTPVPVTLGTVQMDVLNVYNKPTVSTGKVIGQLYLGTEVKIWGRVPAGDWLCIEDPAGWVKAAEVA